MIKAFKKIFKNLLIFILAVVLMIMGVAGYIVFDNSRIVTTKYTYSSSKISGELDGYKICLITDFHNWENYSKVIKAVKKAEPDIICIGGDLINTEDTDFTNATSLVTALAEIAPVYYSYGNHEIANKHMSEFEKALEIDNVFILNDRTVTIEKGDSRLNLTGYGDDIYDDFTFHFREKADGRLSALSSELDEGIPSILIMHRPQYFDVASKYNFDLTLSGHLHGGLINLPKLKEMVLNEHFGTTEYCKGEYEMNEKSMFICAGIKKEDKIYRVFNSPEIVLVELKSE